MGEIQHKYVIFTVPRRIFPSERGNHLLFRKITFSGSWRRKLNLIFPACETEARFIHGSRGITLNESGSGSRLFWQRFRRELHRSRCDHLRLQPRHVHSTFRDRRLPGMVGLFRWTTTDVWRQSTGKQTRVE